MKYGIGLDCGITSVGYCVMDWIQMMSLKELFVLAREFLTKPKIQKTAVLLQSRGERRGDFAEE